MKQGAIIGVLVLAWIICGPSPLIAKVTGPCFNCHTMHNSQGGEVVFATGPLPALLNNECKGCHAGINDGSNMTPYVLMTESEPTYRTTGTEADTDTLAGGNFYWVAMGGLDRTGHNVAGVADPDSPLVNTPPGSVDGASLSEQLTCAGVNGCHGDRSVANPYKALSGGHHNNDMTVWKNGTTLALSYRFLDGVRGLEDPDYEYRPTAAGHHNKYYGEDRTDETDTAEGTISSLCAQCHGYFHNGTGEIAAGTIGQCSWLRHPTDFDMAGATAGSEYSEYNGGTGTNNPYSVVSPVATADTATILNTTVFSKPDDAIVMCLSCHRAHGTPNDAILRWNYKKWPGNDGYNGCAICHTTKN
ncbi:MAG: cytochrome c3 family protein [Deltaproteobacteria bacterium]|nr:cytochrome c3 family protein [Deltaproteobacteria bacterium]